MAEEHPDADRHIQKCRQPGRRGRASRSRQPRAHDTVDQDVTGPASELRHLRCLAAVVDAGTFSDAAADLGLSQAAVSRTIIALEQLLGVRLLHRTSRSVTLTVSGSHVLAGARQILAAADNLVAEVTRGHTLLRIGHAWSAMGRHTREFQRRWALSHPEIELMLIRTNSPTGGLAEGLCDAAVTRTAVDSRSYASAIVGHERRFCALASDDPWARRRSIRLSDIPERTLLIDRRTGTPEGTTAQYRRDGVVFRPLRDAPPITVHTIWPRHDRHPAIEPAVTLLTSLYNVT